MPTPSQRAAITAHRARLAARGMTRFEVVGREQDRALIRELARRVAEEDGLADRLRAQLAGGAPSKGGIFAALRASPLVGADLDITRDRSEGRPFDL